MTGRGGPRPPSPPRPPRPPRRRAVGEPRPAPRGGRPTGADFARALLNLHAGWASDHTLGASVCRGWRAPTLSGFDAMAGIMAANPELMVRVTRLDACGGRIAVGIEHDPAKPLPPGAMARLEAVVAAIASDTSERCPRCGRIVGLDVTSHLRATPTCTPSAIMASAMRRTDAWVESDEASSSRSDPEGARPQGRLEASRPAHGA